MGIEMAAGGRVVLELLFAWSSFMESGVFKTGMYGGAAILLVIGLSMPAVRMFQVLERGRRSGEQASGIIQSIRQTGVSINGDPEFSIILTVTKRDGSQYKREFTQAVRKDELSCFHEGAKILVLIAPDGNISLKMEN
ncbi:hypothetical protein J7E26_15275 [Bacillus sp. ISL-51]|uniref:hypothetical protein n=1 Tax=Bacteria TaxID=2 RepID=UPI001BE68A9C|nr:MULTISPECIES: hypothetical protein [Bacteria]MBT2575287.1 hypothetical protein [Bacillus sp. ISL-51]MBT2712923.1 hypothetical protein [Pseudomonas sp. ISL-88]